MVNIQAARDDQYRGVLEEIAKKEVCPFCPHTFRWHTKPILKRRNGWLITENFNPYKGSSHHFIVIGERHRERLDELTGRDWSAIAYLANWAVKEFGIRGGAVTLRFGEPRYTGASVSHLHAHLIVPKIEKGRAFSVSFPIG